MTFADLTNERYSSRSYTDEPVSDEDIVSILEARRMAPTAKNLQPVRVIVADTPESIARIGKAAGPYGATVALIVVADASKAWVRPQDGKNFGDIDASIVTTQMMYEATDMGLGTLWVCMFKPDVIRRNFGLDDDMIPVNILAVGYRDDQTSKNHGVRIPMDDFVRYA